MGPNTLSLTDDDARSIVTSGDRAEEKMRSHDERHEVSPSSGVDVFHDDIEKRSTSQVQDVNEVQEVTPKTWLVVAVGRPFHTTPLNDRLKCN